MVGLFISVVGLPDQEVNSKNTSRIQCLKYKTYVLNPVRSSKGSHFRPMFKLIICHVKCIGL